MHRQFSLQPFSRHYSHSTNPFLDFLDIESNPDKTRDTPKITATPSKNDDLLEVLTAYKSVQQAGLLHTLTFVTVNDYLWLLRAVSQELSTLGRNALYYLAAAVSDFFLPRQKLVRQSSLSTDQLLSLWGLLVRAQDSIWERQLVD
jgi:phosphopantothenate-cysteine ligase